MPDSSHITHIDAVMPENMDKGDGWLITEFRLPFSERQGLKTTMFHARFNPGAVHKKHRHENCEEVYYLVAGSGIAGAGGSTEEVRAGHFHYVPADTEHWLVNAKPDEPIEAIGWYLGAGSVAATGYAYMGEVSEAERTGPHEGYDIGALSHVDDTAPAKPEPTEGWQDTDFRAGLGERQGIGHTAWRLVLDAGKRHAAHRHGAADTYLFVVSGRGRAGVGDETAEVRAGSCIHVPIGTAHWLEAAADGPLTVIGLYEGAGSLAASGYEYLGEVAASAS